MVSTSAATGAWSISRPCAACTCERQRGTTSCRCIPCFPPDSGAALLTPHCGDVVLLHSIGNARYTAQNLLPCCSWKAGTLTRTRTLTLSLTLTSVPLSAQTPLRCLQGSGAGLCSRGPGSGEWLRTLGAAILRSDGAHEAGAEGTHARLDLPERRRRCSHACHINPHGSVLHIWIGFA